MVLYPVPSSTSVTPPYTVPVGYLYMGVKGELFMWNGADWVEIPLSERERYLVRFTIMEIERERNRDKTITV